MMKDKTKSINQITNSKENTDKKIVVFCQTSKGSGFNTKGYFSSTMPYDQEYLKAKQEVYKKYRNGPQQLVAIDPKQTKASFFIQRGLLKPNNNLQNSDYNKEKIINNFIKNYFHRKQKRQQLQSQKYSSSGMIEKLKGDSMLLKPVSAAETESKAGLISTRSVSNRSYTNNTYSSNKQN